MLKLVLPREKELLFTYNRIDDEYFGAMTNAATLKPIEAQSKPLKAKTHALLIRVFIIWERSME